MAEQEGRKKGFKSSIKGTFGRLFARTDIPIKVKQNAGQTVKTKNIVYVSGSKTWKAKADTAAMLNNGGNNGVQASNPTGISLDFHVTPSDLGSSFGSAQTTQRSGMIENDTYETSGSKTMMVQNGGMRMDGNSSYQHNLQNVGQGGIGSQGQVHNTSYTTQPQVGVGNYYGQQNTGFQNTANQPSTSFTNIPATADGAQSKMAPAGSGQVSPRDRKFERRESERLWNPPTKDKNTYRHQYFIQKQRNLEDDDEVLELMNREPSPVRVDPAALGQGSPPRLQGRHSPPRRQQSRGPVLANITPAFQNQLSGLLGGQHGTGEVNNNNTTLDVNRNGVQGNTQINMNGRSAGAIPLPPPISTIPSVQHGIAMGVSSSGGGMPPPPPPPPHLPQGWITTHPPAPNTGSNPGQNHTIPPSSSSESSEEEDDDEDSDLERKPSLVQRRDVETNTTGTISGTAAMQLRVNGPLDGQVLNIPTPQTTISVPQLSPGSVASNSSTIRMFMQSSPTSIYNPASAATPTYSNASVDVQDAGEGHLEISVEMAPGQGHQRGQSRGRDQGYREAQGHYRGQGHQDGQGHREGRTSDLEGQALQNHVYGLVPGKFEVAYTPVQGGRHQARVTFNGEPVPGSPFPFNVVDASSIRTSGDGLGLVACHRPTTFTLHAPSQAEVKHLKVKITGPEGREVLARVHDDQDGSLVVDWTPRHTGEHHIEVFYHDNPIAGSPFVAKAWDAENVVVSNLRRGVLGQPNNFDIDASRAGSGSLEIVVTTTSASGSSHPGDEGHVPNFVQSLGGARFDVSFTPQSDESHLVSVRFNGEHVPGSPLLLDIEGGHSHVYQAEDGLLRAPVGEIAVLSIDPRRTDAQLVEEQMLVDVIAPSDRVSRAHVTQIPGQPRFKAEFTPVEVGTHCIQAFIGEVEVVGSPFTVECYDLNKVRISRLKKAVVGRVYDFEVDTTEAGEGELEVVVKANNRRVPSKLMSQTRNGVNNAIYRVYFMPRLPIRHLVFVTYSGEQIPESPFPLDVEDVNQVVARGRSLEATPINKRALFEVDASKAPFKSDLKIKILGPAPDKRPLRYNLSGSYMDGWKCEWFPRQLGVHTIEIQYGGDHVAGSPFRCKVYDLNKVIIIRDESMQGVDMDGIPGEDIVFYVDASEAGAGNLEIIVRCAKDGTRIPNFLDATDRSGRFRIYFTPRANCYRYKVDVNFNDEQIKGSPFFCNLVDGERASASGEGLDKFVPTHQPSVINVSTNGVGEAGLEVSVNTPSGRDCPARIVENSSDGYRVEYTPTEVGKHEVRIQYADADIKGSPFYTEVYDASQVIVGYTEEGIVGKQVLFDVDVSKAGKGTLDAEVNGPRTRPKVTLNPQGHDTYQMTFTPEEAGSHVVHLTFNGIPIPDSPFQCDIFDLSDIRIHWDDLIGAKVGQLTYLDIDTRGAPLDELEAIVKDHFNQDLMVEMSREKNGDFQIEFEPQVVGQHTLVLKCADQHLRGSPRVFPVIDPQRAIIKDVTRQSFVGQKTNFTVDTREAGAGDLDVEVKCQGHPVHVHLQNHEAQNHVEQENVYLFTFTPTRDENHVISTMLNGDHVTGSPLSVDVSDPRKRMSISRNSQRQGTVGRSTHSFIETRGLHVQRELVTVHIRAPNGDKVPANIIQQPDGDFKVEYSSKYTGRHTVEILYAGQAIMGSPFYVEIYDPNKIKVLGTPSSIVGQKVEFEIVSHEAGKAELGLNILSPSGKKVPYDTMPTSLGEKVTYLPTEPGPHNIYITYGGLEVPGNPITQNIVDSGSGVTVYGEGLSRAEVGKHARFYVDSKGHRGEITRHQVDGPNSYAKCQIEPDGAGRYIFSYVPLEVGDFSVRLEWNHRELSGCPYRVKVVDPAAVGLIGGWEQHLDAQRHLSLQVNQTKQLEFDVSRAGPGRLSAEVEGPNGALVPTYVERRGNGTEVISFTPFQEGMHHVKIHWGEFALAHLPFSGLANASSRVSHEKVVLTGRGLKEARVKEEAEFVIDGTEAGQGEPHVTLSGVKADVPVRLHSLGSNRYRASYVANMAGAYLLNIQWSDRQVKGSPFKVNVVSVGDAAKVRTSGEGLQMGIMGREIKATIDTRHAGPGELTAQCEGPTKIAYCTLIDHRDGTFTLSVKPQEPGKHILQIKYDGEHVQGSPYTLKISGAPDASKVVVRGPGIENGILAIYQSAFICETKGAGAGQLTVRIRGPKAAFRVEMQRDSQKDRTIKCKYDPTEVGEYIVAVRWSDEHVPGSPFKVHIFDTKDQLDRFNMENPTLMRRTTGPNAVSGSQFAGWHDTF